MSNASGPDTHTRIYLVPHPKIVFLYPSVIVAVIAGLVAHFSHNQETRPDHVLSLLFLIVLGVNLSVIAFDFPRTTSLTMFFAILAIGIGANTAIFSVISGVLLKPLPYANGDRLVLVRQSAPLAGRADDFAWPRREVEREQIKGEPPAASASQDGLSDARAQARLKLKRPRR